MGAGAGAETNNSGKESGRAMGEEGGSPDFCRFTVILEALEGNWTKSKNQMWPEIFPIKLCVLCKFL